MRTILLATLIAVSACATSAGPEPDRVIDYGDVIADVRVESERRVAVELRDKFSRDVVAEVRFDRAALVANWKLADGTAGTTPITDDPTVDPDLLADAAHMMWLDERPGVNYQVDEPGQCMRACGWGCSQCTPTTTVAETSNDDGCFEQETTVYACQCADCCTTHDFCRRSCEWWNVGCQAICDLAFADCIGGVFPELGIPVPGGFRDCSYTATGPVTEVACPEVE
jgi:hypothetical protein